MHDFAEIGLAGGVAFYQGLYHGGVRPDGGDGVAWFHSGGVAVADGPDAGRTAVGGEAQTFKLTDKEEGVW